MDSHLRVGEVVRVQQSSHNRAQVGGARRRTVFTKYRAKQRPTFAAEAVGQPLGDRRVDHRHMRDTFLCRVERAIAACWVRSTQSSRVGHSRSSSLSNKNRDSKAFGPYQAFSELGSLPQRTLRPATSASAWNRGINPHRTLGLAPNCIGPTSLPRPLSAPPFFAERISVHLYVTPSFIAIQVNMD
ncbi:uncharacterized protein J3R85_008391 [Psidium guajava]|nr:uncharacterized protein J3R85_008391 [Psidium guajava]